MERINNTNKLSTGDIILSIPKTLLLNPKTRIILDTDDKCCKIDLHDCDIESFAEEIGIGTVKLNDVRNHELFIENIYNGDGMWVPDDMLLNNKNKTYWKD